jgi:hypothetical protein
MRLIVEISNGKDGVALAREACTAIVSVTAPNTMVVRELIH